MFAKADRDSVAGGEPDVSMLLGPLTLVTLPISWTILSACCPARSVELRQVLDDKRSELRRRIEALHYLDRRLAHLQGDLAAGESPRPLITIGKEDHHATT